MHSCLMELSCVVRGRSWKQVEVLYVHFATPTFYLEANTQDGRPEDREDRKAKEKQYLS